MEGSLRSRVRSVVMVWLVMGLLLMPPTTSTTASTFTSCYVGCFILCVIVPTNTATTCALQCLKDCIVPSSPRTVPLTHAAHPKENIFYFCKLGCASSLCSNFSTKHNPSNLFSAMSHIYIQHFLTYFLVLDID